MYKPLLPYIFWWLVGVIALPFILLFTSKTATKLPVLDRYLGNEKTLNYARAGVMRKNGDSWWWRYVWLGWRNAAYNYCKQVVGYKTADIETFSESAPFADKSDYRSKVVLKDGRVFDQHYSWTPLFKNWGWYMKRGWKNHRRPFDDTIGWVPPYGQLKEKNK